VKQKTFSFIVILSLGLLMTAGTVWALAAGTTASPGIADLASVPDQREAASRAVHWLVRHHQNDDGGYGSFSAGANQANSNVAGTLDAILAISSAGYNPATNFPGKDSNPLTYLRNNASEAAAFVAQGGGPAGKMMLGLVAANQDPRDFMGYNFVISLTQQLSPSGQYNAGTAFDQSLAVLGLAAVNETVPFSATQWLQDQQAANGSWDDGYGTLNNADATGMSIMALVASGQPLNSTSLVSAANFLAAAQLPTGGWEYGTGFGENANSTSLALQGLSALGEDFFTSSGPWDQGGNTPLSALLSWQNKSGAFQADFGFGRFDDFFATTQSIPGTAGKAYPLPGRYEAARQAVACLATLQDPASGAWEQFAGFGINAGGTSRAIEAIAAFGDDPQSADWTPGAVNAVEALENLAPDYLANGRGGRVGVVMQGAAAAGPPYSVTDFAGFNLPVSMTYFLEPGGEYANTAFGPSAHSEAMLGLLVAGTDPDPSAVTWLKNAAINGSWGGPDADGLSINVLGRLGEHVSGSIVNLRDSQQADGGWGFALPSNPNSTSEVVQGLVQNLENPFEPAWSKVVSGTLQNPADVILNQQLPSGCWPAFAGGDGPFATTDAILLLMQEPGWKKSTFLPLIIGN